MSKISRIRRELQFPQIEMNKIQYYADNFNLIDNGSENSSNIKYLMESESENLELGPVQNELEDDECNDGYVHLGNQRGLPSNLVQQISLQPSLEASEDKISQRQHSEAVLTSNTGNSLEEICQEISDIQLNHDNSNNQNRTKTTNADNHSLDSLSANQINAKMRSSKQNAVRNFSKAFIEPDGTAKPKQIDPRMHHQTYLFSENHNEEDFQIP